MSSGANQYVKDKPDAVEYSTKATAPDETDNGANQYVNKEYDSDAFAFRSCIICIFYLVVRIVKLDLFNLVMCLLFDFLFKYCERIR